MFDYREVLCRQTGLIPSIQMANCLSPFHDGTHLALCHTGQINEIYPHLGLKFQSDKEARVIGSGCALQPEFAQLKAVFEALERYSAVVYSERDLTLATAEDLGADSIDWTLFENLYVRSPLTGETTPNPFDPRKPIRWITAYHAVKKRAIYVPMIMTHIHSMPRDGEEFYPQTTTGIAAHVSPEAAIVSALCEVIERDAVETVWRTRAPLQQIDIDVSLPPGCNELHDRDCASRAFVDQRYYDATLELGIPTIYSVRKLMPPVGNDVIVSCASHPNALEALYKARLEASSQQIMRQNESAGACYSRYKSESGFLVKDCLQFRPDLSFLGPTSEREKPLSALCEFNLRSNSWDAASVLSIVSERHKEIAIIDISTDEMLNLGVHVFKAVIPTLMPSAPSEFQSFARHRRMLDVASFFGLRDWTLSNFNSDPQPFC